MFIFSSTLIYPQSSHYITGKVTDTNSSPLLGANIILKRTYQGATTDSVGNYRIDNIDPGKYTIMVGRQNYTG